MYITLFVCIQEKKNKTKQKKKKKIPKNQKKKTVAKETFITTTL